MYACVNSPALIKGEIIERKKYHKITTAPPSEQSWYRTSKGMSPPSLKRINGGFRKVRKTDF